MFSGQDIKAKWLVLVAIAALGAFVIACGTDETPLVKDPGTGSDGVGAQPVETPVGDNEPLPDDMYDTVDELAPIESVQILVLESYPEQFVVQIFSGIPNGCTSYSHTEVTQDGSGIYISVYNSVPSPDQLAFIACAAIYGIHEESLSLGSDFERGTVFSVHVNDHPAVTFETGSAPVSEIGEHLPPYEDPEFVVEPAPVEGIEIVITEENGATTYSASVLIGLSNGCKEAIEPNVVQSARNVFDVYPVVKSPTGDVMCIKVYQIVPVEAVLGTVGEELAVCATYTVNAADESVTFQAITPNVRCADPDAATPTPAPSTGGGLIADSHVLELTLTNEGADVQYGGGSDFTSLFGIKPTELKVNGQQVLVYEFAPGTSAEQASEGISVSGTSIDFDGTVETVHWISTPHFYLFGSSIVLYIGNDAEMGELLSVLGGQIAGGDFDDSGSAMEMTTKQATVEKVSMASTRSIPAQHLVGVTILLNSGCEEFHSIDWSVEGREVYVDVLTQVPVEPVPCILMVSYEDHSINIGSHYEAGVEYDVIVNGERQGTFIGG